MHTLITWLRNRSKKTDGIFGSGALPCLVVTDIPLNGSRNFRFPDGISMGILDFKLAALGAAILRGPWPKTEALKANELWKDGSPPTVIYAVRRMG